MKKTLSILIFLNFASMAQAKDNQVANGNVGKIFPVDATTLNFGPGHQAGGALDRKVRVEATKKCGSEHFRILSKNDNGVYDVILGMGGLVHRDVMIECTAAVQAGAANPDLAKYAKVNDAGWCRVSVNTQKSKLLVNCQHYTSSFNYNASGVYFCDGQSCKTEEEAWLSDGKTWNEAELGADRWRGLTSELPDPI